MTDREVMQQALEALEHCCFSDALVTDKDVAADAIYTLRTALEQQQAEPVAYYHPHKGFYWAKPTYISAPIVVDVPPVPLYVKWKAAQRPWQGLTDEDICVCDATSDLPVHDITWGNLQLFARAIEAKLKEKNT